jgi:hypothetical protein
MLDLYIALVKAGKRTIENVPDKFRAQVRQAVEATGENA